MAGDAGGDAAGPFGAAGVNVAPRGKALAEARRQRNFARELNDQGVSARDGGRRGFQPPFSANSALRAAISASVRMFLSSNMRSRQSAHFS